MNAPCKLFIQLKYQLIHRSPTFLAPGTGFMEDNFSTDQGWGRGDGSSGDANDGEGRGGTGSDGERRGAAGEASLAHRRPLTSCCAARFLTGRRPIPVCGPGVGDPWINHLHSTMLDTENREWVTKKKKDHVYPYQKRSHFNNKKEKSNLKICTKQHQLKSWKSY